MRNREFVEAAEASVASIHLRIIFVEIFPNEIAIVAAELLGTVIYAILAEAGLEYLGLGDLSGVSWGTMFYWAANNDALTAGLLVVVRAAGALYCGAGRWPGVHQLRHRRNCQSTSAHWQESKGGKRLKSGKASA